jgi:hypothetical protein
MNPVFSGNKTSAKLLADFASANWGMEKDGASPELQRRFLMVYDLYIKARSYAIINKISFWLSVAAGIMVLAWPSIAVISKDFGVDKEFLKSAIVQTSVTALAVLTFAVYSHYKKRQMVMENLMRHVVFSNDATEALLERVLKEMERIDTGFVFSESILKKGGPKPGAGA